MPADPDSSASVQAEDGRLRPRTTPPWRTGRKRCCERSSPAWSRSRNARAAASRRARSVRRTAMTASPDSGEARPWRGRHALAVRDQAPTSQLLVYRFGPDAEFEGRLVGALERIESGGAMRVL